MFKRYCYCIIIDTLTGTRVPLPTEWSVMRDDESIKLVDIKNGDANYVAIEQRFIAEVKGGKYKDRVGFSIDPNKVVVTKVRFNVLSNQAEHLLLHKMSSL